LQKQLLLDIGMEESKIFYKPNFLSGFSNALPPKFESREPFYLYAGRLSEEKGIKDLVNAFKENGKSILIVGDGPLANWVQNETNDQIRYSKALPREYLEELYASCQAFIVPSRWFEGQPTTVIEAQSTGAIVIAAYSDNLGKMIDHGINGFLYQIQPNYQLNELIHNFESMSIEAKEEMSKASYQHFLEHYTLERHQEAIKQLYHFDLDHE